MTLPFDLTPDFEERARAIRERIASIAPQPAEYPEDFQRSARDAQIFAATGKFPIHSSALRVRLFGAGVINHDVPVNTATAVLAALQGAVTATGEAVRRQGALPSKSADAQRVTADATELYLSPEIAPGSVVFFLETKDARSQDNIVAVDVESLLDVATDRLFALLSLADSGDVAERSELETELRELGSRAASKVASLATAAIENEVELDLSLQTPIGRRSSGHLTARGSFALQRAFSQASDRVERTRLMGRLRTVSDGKDKLRMTVEALGDIRLVAEPNVGANLGNLLGQRIAADVEVTVKWTPATGRERRTYRMLGAEAAPEPSLEDDSEPIGGLVPSPGG
jgi:hypothetical protein